MDTVVLIVLAVVVALVAIDAIGRFDERRPVKRPPTEQSEKIVVDLSKRR